jgi:hypothetical protein
MKIIEVVGAMLDGSFGVYAARDESEVKALVLLIQEQGGIPMVGEAEVPDTFDMFALDMLKQIEERMHKQIEEPSLN